MADKAICTGCWQQAQTPPCSHCQGSGWVQDEQLSEHFLLSELLLSNKARSLCIANVPDEQQLANLRRLAVELLEPARAIVGPIKIDSGLRVDALNAAIPGSSKTSVHRFGLAADCVPLDISRREMMQRVVKSDLAFDQIIFEGSWCHLGILSPHGEQRRQVLMKCVEDGHLTYKPYDVDDPPDAE